MSRRSREPGWREWLAHYWAIPTFIVAAVGVVAVLAYYFMRTA